MVKARHLEGAEWIWESCPERPTGRDRRQLDGTGVSPVSGSGVSV